MKPRTKEWNGSITHPRIEFGGSIVDGKYDSVRGRTALGMSSSGLLSDSSRERFKPWPAPDNPASKTTVSSVEAEDNGGSGGELSGKDIELVAPFWEALTGGLRMEHKGFAENTHLTQVDLCPFHLVRLKSPSPSSTTLMPHNAHLTILESKAATWESFTRSRLRFAAATRLLGLEVENDKIGKLKET